VSTSNRRLSLLSVPLLAVAFFAFAPPIAQDQNYQTFADQRTLYGVPNFWNVFSNAAFLVAALYGVAVLRARPFFINPWERTAFGIFIAGAAMVGIGSAYYHLHPDDSRLFWDRLPMTVVFMALLATTVGERVSMQAGEELLLPLILAGVSSVVCWRLSGDLRFSAVIQFGSLLAVLLMLACLPPVYSASRFTWWMLGLYVVAKAAELLDRQIAFITSTGGHPLKHLAAAAAAVIYIRGTSVRRLLPVPAAALEGVTQ
jgi:hypothetical protein